MSKENKLKDLFFTDENKENKNNDNTKNSRNKKSSKCIRSSLKMRKKGKEA